MQFILENSNILSALVYALRLPLMLYILLYGVVFSIATLEKTHSFDPSLVSLVDYFYQIGSVLLIGWSFFRFIHQFEVQAAAKRPLGYDRTTLRGVSQVLKVFVLAFTGLSVLQILGIPISGIIAFGGIGGIAVGFAAKDLLANIFGGMMIFLDRQFRIGDWIRSPDQEIEGMVEEIGWRLTKLQTADKRPLFVPNSVFSTISLENYSQIRSRRIKTQITFNYQDAPKMALVLADIEKELKSHPAVDLSSEYFVNLVSFSPFGLDVSICAHTKITQTLEFQAVQQDLFLKILDCIRRHDCEIGHPINHFLT